MNRAGPELSVVVPIYNEAENLEPLVGELVQVLPGIVDRYELLLVDDGSTDGSAAEIRRLAGRYAQIVPIRLAENRGQTAAFDAGFRAATGEWVATMDGDLQNDPRDIAPLLAAVRGDYDAAAGYRERRRDSWSRRVLSRLANGIRNRISGDDIVDTCCSLKVFRREPVTALKLHVGMHRFLPTLLRIEGYRVCQLPVNHRPRRHGSSKYGILDRAWRSFVDLLAVRWMKSRRLDYEVLHREH